MYYYHGKVQRSSRCPHRYKSDLVDWAANKWPKTTKQHWKDKSFNQLKAIWYNTQ